VGVERAVTRWYVQRQLLLYKLASLEEQAQQKQAEGMPPDAGALATLQRQLREVREELRAIGDCPKPRMG
jgi:hypothetical protein